MSFFRDHTEIDAAGESGRAQRRARAGLDNPRGHRVDDNAECCRSPAVVSTRRANVFTIRTSALGPGDVPESPGHAEAARNAVAAIRGPGAIRLLIECLHVAGVAGGTIAREERRHRVDELAEGAGRGSRAERCLPRDGQEGDAMQLPATWRGVERAEMRPKRSSSVQATFRHSLWLIPLAPFSCW